MRSHQVRRLPQGGRIDRTAALTFTFDGRPMEGFQGDTLASALLANGVDVVGRSFKYARPRGIVGHGAEEPNAIVQVGVGAASLPTERATQVELYAGLAARSLTGVAFKRVAGVFGRAMPVGFYYKMLMAPPRLWSAWERVLRRGAGLGDVPVGSDPDRYDKVNRHCDVMVVGAGPAGLAAALAAARTGARVIVVDEQNELGGALLASTTHIAGATAVDWTSSVVAELGALDNVELLARSTVFGFYDHNFLGILERRSDHLGPVAREGTRQRLHRVRAKQVVLATGAIERPLVFANNDRPGVMLASAVSGYVNRYGVAPGERLLLFTTNDNAYRTALDWLRVGREVVAVVDSRQQPTGALVESAKTAGIEVVAGHGVVEALGGRRVQAALAARLNASGTALRGRPFRLACDLIACSGGWNPVVHLSSQTGTRPVWSDAAAGFLPGESRRAICAGAVAGAYTVRACLAQGTAAGERAASAAGFDAGATVVDPVPTDEQPEPAGHALFLVPHRRPTSRAPRQFVDLQLDVTAADIELAAREGFESVEHVKRYTALGFGTDQGKLGNVNGVAILARALGTDISEVGTTMFRPAYTPVSFGAVAGRDVGGLFDPERRTPMHDWHEQRGAVWEDVGRWKRPWYYPESDETMAQTVARECLAARNGVAMLDASTLGKIDIQGPDAARFLDRVYAGGFLKLAVGRARYGLMLKDDGMIFDDGVTVRLGEHRYLMHTTTGNAEAVLAWLELWRQTEWPDLRVFMTSVTDHWATAAVVGPRARDVLRKVCGDIDLAPETFRFMTCREGHVADARARVFRISFSGELSFEVNVSAHDGLGVWRALMAAGEEFGITPYGTETMHVLRAEKGFIVVGQDTDGSMTPNDMGLDWAVRHNKRFGFIGERSLALADLSRDDRPQFVGLKTVDPSRIVPEGAQIVLAPQIGRPGGRVAMAGHVTSSYFSAALDGGIALAMVKRGRARIGETVYCFSASRSNASPVAAKIVDPVFYDPEGARQHG